MAWTWQGNHGRGTMACSWQGNHSLIIAGKPWPGQGRGRMAGEPWPAQGRETMEGNHGREITACSKQGNHSLIIAGIHGLITAGKPSPCCHGLPGLAVLPKPHFWDGSISHGPLDLPYGASGASLPPALDFAAEQPWCLSGRDKLCRPCIISKSYPPALQILREQHQKLLSLLVAFLAKIKE